MYVNKGMLPPLKVPLALAIRQSERIVFAVVFVFLVFAQKERETENFVDEKYPARIQRFGNVTIMGLSENGVSGKTRPCVPCGAKRNRSSKYSTAKKVSIYCISTCINVKGAF